MAQYRKDSFLRRAENYSTLFLGLNTLPTIPKTVKDEIYTIGHGYDERPDLLAQQLYGSSRLWWVFAMRNPDILIDPIADFTAGTKIILPSEEAVNLVSKG